MTIDSKSVFLGFVAGLLVAHLGTLGWLAAGVVVFGSVFLAIWSAVSRAEYSREGSNCPRCGRPVPADRETCEYCVGSADGPDRPE